MFFIEQGDWQPRRWRCSSSRTSAISGSFVFYDSLLPHIAADDEMDRVSSAGYALGYLGGGLLLVLNLLWIMKPRLVRAARRGRGVAPVVPQRRGLVARRFRSRCSGACREPPVKPDAAAARGRQHRARVVRASSLDTLREFRRYRQAFLMLLAFLIYNDGIGTIIRMAGLYGTEIEPAGERADRRDRDGAVRRHPVRVRSSARSPGASAPSGRSSSRWSSTSVISILGYFMTAAWQFFLLAFLVGTVQGGSQALSRSLFATMIPRHKSSEFFGFFAVFEKFAGIFGPALFAVTVALTGLEPQRDPVGDRVLRRRARCCCRRSTSRRASVRPGCQRNPRVRARSEGKTHCSGSAAQPTFCTAIGRANAFWSECPFASSTFAHVSRARSASPAPS